MRDALESNTSGVVVIQVAEQTGTPPSFRSVTGVHPCDSFLSEQQVLPHEPQSGHQFSFCGPRLVISNRCTPVHLI